jgi:hypothetical protein
MGKKFIYFQDLKLAKNQKDFEFHNQILNNYY